MGLLGKLRYRFAAGKDKRVQLLGRLAEELHCYRVAFGFVAHLAESVNDFVEDVLVVSQVAVSVFDGDADLGERRRRVLRARRHAPRELGHRACNRFQIYVDKVRHITELLQLVCGKSRLFAECVYLVGERRSFDNSVFECVAELFYAVGESLNAFYDEIAEDVGL